MRVIKAWGGFLDGKLFVLPPSNPAYRQYDEPRYAVFKNRAAAERAYSDVRRVEIHIPEPADD